MSPRRKAEQRRRGAASELLASMIQSFELDLRARGLAKGTINLYVDAAHRFGSWLRDNGDPNDWSAVTDDHIKRYVVHLLGLYATGYANNQFRAVQQFFKWHSAEEDLPNPMSGLKPPVPGSKVVPVFKRDEMARLVKDCERGR